MSDRLLGAVFGAIVTLAAGSAAAFDGTPSPRQMPRSPTEMARAGSEAFRAGDMQSAIASWSRAAEGGHLASAWRLGRLFADGESVRRDHLAAFRWFSLIVETHADEEPGSPSAQIASRAFVEVGAYYLAGIPGTEVQQDFPTALRMFYHAASVFRDAEAQFHLGRMYLDGNGVDQNARQAVHWLGQAAQKRHRQAQATLGEILFSGRMGVPARRVEGLTLLVMARQQARGPGDHWIIGAFEDAFTLATIDERQSAMEAARTGARALR